MALFMCLLMKEGAKDMAISTAQMPHSPKRMYEYSAYMQKAVRTVGDVIWGAMKNGVLCMYRVVVPTMHATVGWVVLLWHPLRQRVSCDGDNETDISALNGYLAIKTRRVCVHSIRLPPSGSDMETCDRNCLLASWLNIEPPALDVSGRHGASVDQVLLDQVFSSISNLRISFQHQRNSRKLSSLSLPLAGGGDRGPFSPGCMSAHLETRGIETDLDGVVAGFVSNRLHGMSGERKVLEALVCEHVRSGRMPRRAQTALQHVGKFQVANTLVGRDQVSPCR
eukprot:767147-Hanusia_phi.AAC.3